MDGLIQDEVTEKLTLGTLFREAGEDFFGNHPGLNLVQVQAARHIMQCQTAALGGHLWRCDHCGAAFPFYNSCRDSHCPTCQGEDRRRWAAARRKEVLPTNYFHTVMTLPHSLNPLVAANLRPLLGLLFKAASQTLLKLAADPKYLGGTPAILMTLHTWGQQLNRHYHVHCIVTGGGLSKDDKWVSTRSPNYLFPQKVISKVFRGIYWQGLSKMLAAGELRIPTCMNSKDRQEVTTTLANQVHKNDWVVKVKAPIAESNKALPILSSYVSREPIEAKRLLDFKPKPQQWKVYCAPPENGVEQVIDYLAEYDKRVGITNRRILSCEDGVVTFSYRDYRHDDRLSTRSLPLEIFLLRFLNHVLPKGFMRIRFYGIWANTKKKTCLPLCRKLLSGQKTDDLVESSPEVADNSEHEAKPTTDFLCPRCSKGHLLLLPLPDPRPAFPASKIDSS